MLARVTVGWRVSSRSGTRSRAGELTVAYAPAGILVLSCTAVRVEARSLLRSALECLRWAGSKCMALLVLLGLTVVMVLDSVTVLVRESLDYLICDREFSAIMRLAIC